MNNLVLRLIHSLPTNIYPKITFGRPITDMEPFAEPKGL
jgi:hypothetical protein